MARSTLIFSIALLCIYGANSGAVITSTKLKKHARLLRQCEEGNGKSCYDYGRALWSTPGAIDRKRAVKYFLRGCELTYQPSCGAAADNSTKSVRTNNRKPLRPSEGAIGNCFSPRELDHVRLNQNAISASSVHGQRVSDIQKNSIWQNIGLKENDLLVRINNMPTNTQEDLVKAFASSGKKFGFEVERNGRTITLWYSCQ